MVSVVKHLPFAPQLSSQSALLRATTYQKILSILCYLTYFVKYCYFLKKLFEH